MIKRRKQLLLQLLREKKPVTTKELARELKVSEKTIRNDLKQLDGWLSSRSDAEICRRPGVGIFLYASEKEKEKLEHLAVRSARFPTGTEPAVRRNEMLLDLFFSKKSPTPAEWARRFYVSKATIHHDLAEISKHL